MKYYMITKRDVGRRYLRLFGHVYVLADSIGYVMAQDVGKRIYISGGVLQLESDDQYHKRMEGQTK